MADLKEDNQPSKNLVSAVLEEIRCHAGLSVVLEQAIAHLGPYINIGLARGLATASSIVTLIENLVESLFTELAQYPQFDW